MKTLSIILCITALLAFSNLSAQNKSIIATVVNVTSDEGKVEVALYNKINFMKKPLMAKTADIENGKSTITFENLT